MKSYSKYLFLFALNAIVYSSMCQGIFNHLYDNNDSSGRANSVIQTKDSGFVIVGTGGNADYLSVVKTNSKGVILWEIFNDLNSGLSGGVIGYTATQINNGNIVIGGLAADTSQIPGVAFLMEATHDGNIIKTIQYGSDSTAERFYDVKQTKDDGLILIGWKYPISGVESDVYLVKTDSSGNVEWETTFGGPDYDFTRALDFTTDGGYILGGSTKSSGIDNYDMYLVKTDSNGNFLWQKTFGSTGSDYALDMLTTSDGGYILAGSYEVDVVSNNHAGWVMKTDSTGNVQWERKYDRTTVEYNEFTAIKELYDGNFVVAGNSYQGKKGVEYLGWLLKLKPNGDTIWTRTYQYFQDTAHHYFYGMDLCNDGGFVMAGMTIDLHKKGKNTGNDMWLVKTDSCGYTVGNSPQPQASFSIDSANAMRVYLKNTTADGCWYKWHFGDGDSAVTLNASHVYKDTGTYIVTLYAYAGDMSNTISLPVKIYLVGEKEAAPYNHENDFQVIVDDNHSIIHITNPHYEKYKNVNVQFEMIDLTGRKLKSLTLRKNNLSIEYKNISSGIYFYQITVNSERVKTGKMVVY